MKYHELIDLIKQELEATVEDMVTSPEDYGLDEVGLIDDIDEIGDLDQDRIIAEIASQWSNKIDC